jgi:hypothetical protein
MGTIAPSIDDALILARCASDATGAKRAWRRSAIFRVLSGIPRST